MTRKVYIAGPDVFRQDWPKFTTSVCACFEGHENFAPVFPIPPDQSLDRPDLPGSTLQGTRADAFPVSDRCIDLINGCEFVLANISPFRGEEPDSGTVVEIVRAHLMGKIVVAYTNRLPPNIDPDIYRKTEHGAFVDAKGYILENFGIPCNLMVASHCTHLLQACTFSALSFLLKQYQDREP